jgi:hypothetical protein
VFWGQYLPLSLSKRGVPYIKKRKKKASAKKRAAQNKKNQKCGCPILPRLRTYPFLPGLKTGLILLVRSCCSDLSNFTRAENLSVFTRAENWSDLACPFCLFLPRLRTCQFLPGPRTCPIFPRAENLSDFPTGWELVRLIVLVVALITINRLVARPARPASRTTWNPWKCLHPLSFVLWICDLLAWASSRNEFRPAT